MISHITELLTDANMKLAAYYHSEGAISIINIEVAALHVSHMSDVK